jgi:hypothetical protein
VVSALLEHHPEKHARGPNPNGWKPVFRKVVHKRQIGGGNRPYSSCEDGAEGQASGAPIRLTVKRPS